MTEKRPVCTSGIVSRMKAGMFTCHGWPSVCRDETGTLSVVCSGYRCLHICPFGKTLLFQSRDDGKTWSAPIVVNDTDQPLESVRFDLAKLNALVPGARLDLVNEETMEHVAVDGEEIRVTVPPRDYVILGNFK